MAQAAHRIWIDSLLHKHAQENQLSQKFDDNLDNEECAPLLKKPGAWNSAMWILSSPQHNLLFPNILAKDGGDDRGREAGEHPENLIRRQLIVVAFWHQILQKGNE